MSRYSVDIEDLIIKEDKSEKNNIDDKDENYNPNQPRDEQGKWTTGGSGITGKAVMSEKEAKKATKNSKYKELLWHGTSNENARQIAEENFKPEKSERGLHGDGIYLTPEYYDARSYAFNGESYNSEKPQQVIKSYIDVKNPYRSKTDGSETDLGAQTNKSLGVDGYSVDSMGYPSNPAEFERWQTEFKKHAQEVLKEHDALIIDTTGSEGGQPVVIVRDPSVVKIFSIEDVNAEFRKES